MILAHLINNDGYARKVIPHLDPDYFEKTSHQICCKLVLDYYKKYNKQATREILKIELDSKRLPEKIFREASEFIDELKYNEQSADWMFDKTEQYCKERALNNALIKAVEYSESPDKKGLIPDVLQKALSVTFDSNIGHDFFKDAEDRYDRFHEETNKLPFDIDLLNKITKGGVVKKTLNCLIAASGVGKSLALCHFAASNLSIGKNVLYITLEMSEDWIAKRIESNLFNFNINDIDTLEKEEYLRKISKIRSKTHGNLIVKEYPTSGANAGHFRYLLSELKQKQGFIPDVIYIDYLNICSSFKVTMAGGSYGYIKSIAEELRALAVEYDVPVFTATQVNREGAKSSDFSETDVSESIGIVFALDLFLAMISTEELEKMNLIRFKQLKNRYGPKDYYGSFAVGIDRTMMKLYDAENSAQSTITNGPQQTQTTQSVKDKFKEVFG